VDGRDKPGHDVAFVMQAVAQTIPSNQTQPLRSYGRRKGHALSPRQTRLVDELLPTLAIDAASPAGSFAAPSDIWLEIGFGGGEHLLAQATRHPDIGFIGAEPYLNGVASLLGRIEAGGPSNIRIHHGDARELVDALPDACLGRVFVLFPDPWPKARHVKRRLVNAELSAALGRVLRPGGELRFASDIEDYADAARAAILRSGLFIEAPLDEDWPQTRYEAKALLAGRAPRKLVFARM
jgi:tRNA (guanine-N7-)-methyltransferase